MSAHFTDKWTPEKKTAYFKDLRSKVHTFHLQDHPEVASEMGKARWETDRISRHKQKPVIEQKNASKDLQGRES